MNLKVEELTQRYGEHIALDHLNYEFTPGIYGLLGPNGAGKSTLMNLLSSNLKIQSGQILYQGTPIHHMGADYRKKIGYMPQQQSVYPYFTLERFMWYMAGLKGLKNKEAEKEIERLLSLVNLSENVSSRMREFSGGMKQRALLAQALLGNPEIIILDEPTAGLDPKERIRLRNLIAQVAFDSIILIATHVVSDVQFIAKEVLLMSKGKIIDSGIPGALCEKINGMVYEIETDDTHFEEICRRYKVANVYRESGNILIRVLSKEVPSGYVFRSVHPNLEDLYLQYFE